MKMEKLLLSHNKLSKVSEIQLKSTVIKQCFPAISGNCRKVGVFRKQNLILDLCFMVSFMFAHEETRKK